MTLTEAGLRHADEWLRGVTRGAVAVGNDEVMGRLIADEIDRLTAELAEARELLNWIDANTTLHKSVETAYYVDHYEVNVLYDGDLYQRNVGESIEDAIRAAIKAKDGE